MSQPPSSQLFWAEALALEAEAEVPAAPQRRPSPPRPTTPSPPRKRVRYVLSPDTSDLDIGAHEGNVPSSPFSPAQQKESTADTTTLQYLPDRASLLHDPDSAHAYLAADEYSGVAFGDIGDYMRKKDTKVQTQNAAIAAAAANQNLPQVFAGLTFYINGNTTPSMPELRQMILQRGGVCVPYVRGKTGLDYIIAPVLTLAKFREFKTHKIVREAWIVECVKQGRMADWRKYRLRADAGEARLDGFVKSDAGDVGGSHPTPTGMDVRAPTPKAPASRGAPLPPAFSAALAPVAATQSLLRPLRPTQQRSQPVSTPHPVIPTRPIAPAPPSIALSPQPAVSPPAEDEPPAKEAANVVKEAAARPEGAWDNYFVHKSNHQAAQLMKSDVFRANNTSERGNDAGFIDNFYQNSRLHHLSTWKAELRVLVAEARSVASVSVPTVLAPTSAERVYLHVDFDAFFVSAGLSSRQHLRGKPVVVCHSSRGGRDSTSEIASASYEARAKGVKNGMSLGRARQLVGAELETIPYEFETYKKHSLSFYTVLLGYADELEAVSVDEAILDVTGAVTAITLAPTETGATSSDPAVLLSDKIRDDIRAKTGCEVSIGIAHNLLLARLATRKAKPAGIFHLRKEAVPEFLAQLDVDQLPSVGHSTRAKMLDKFGSTSCATLLSQSNDVLRRTLGPKTGDTIYGFLRGVDDRQLQPDKERKSVSAETNYGIRFQNQDQADRYVADLAAEVSKRLRSIGARGAHITLKIMARHPDAPVEPPKFLGHGKCETFTKTGLLGRPTDDAGVLGPEVVKLLRAMRLDPVELRGVGIQITRLETGAPKGQATLSFNKPSNAIDASVALASPNKPARVPLDTSVPPSPQPPQVVVPSSDKIDPEWLSALPPDLRREFDETRSAARSTKRTRTDELSPPKPVAAKTKLNPAAHITRQLRPKLKTQLGVKAIGDLALYSAWGRAPPREEQPARSHTGRAAPESRGASAAPGDSDSDADIEILSDNEEQIGGVGVSELRTLGIAPDYFSALPVEDQREVLEERRAHHKRQQARARTPTTRASPAGNRQRTSRSASAAPTVPALRARDRHRPSLYKKTETGDVAQMLAAWVASRPSPAAEDVRRVGAYLIKCVTGSMGGMDHVAVLLRGMRGVLRDRERVVARVVGEGEVGEMDVDQWWVAFDELKRGVDAVLVQAMGAPLGL